MKMEDPLDAVRSLMSAHSPPLDALIVPSEDAHQSEYVAARDKRREFISGFTGSAGLALVTMTEALLWTDGRYFLQASQQLSDRWKLMKIGEDPLLQIWLADNLEKGATVGVDPWCVSIETAQKWEFHFGKSGLVLIQLSTNLVDEIWKSRPLSEIHPVVVQPLKFAGCRVEVKLSDLREKLAQEQASGIVITALDEVAWLYNIRGSDVSYNPVVHAFAIVTLSSAFLYMDKRKVTAEMLKYFSENRIEVRNYGDVVSDLASLESGQLIHISDINDGDREVQEHKNTLIWMDPVSCCYALYSNLSSNHALLQQSPLALAKALKNPVELDGLRNAHVRDGAAVVQYLMWLDNKMQEIYGAPGYFSELKDAKRKNYSDDAKLTEVSVSDVLESFRAKQELFKGLSFPTISSVGPNAAIIHYSPEEGTCMEMDPDSIYLVDSGAQYQDGTTDITRTVHFGKPSEHEKTCYTAVLKGHIALDTAVFPNETTGHALDILARIPLWKEGLDYRHGTGHGIGCYLNVHEGPHLISFRLHARNVPLQASMTVTDEPGYYEDGSFGIRLENVLVVKEEKTEYNFGEKGYLSFEHITWVPYQKKLIDLSMLTPQEIRWVDSYHSKCQEILASYLNESEMAWLKKASEPLACGA